MYDNSLKIFSFILMLFCKYWNTSNAVQYAFVVCACRGLNAFNIVCPHITSGAE